MDNDHYAPAEVQSDTSMKFRNTNAHFDERYYQYNGVGDMNLLKADTSIDDRKTILNTKDKFTELEPL